MVLEANHQARQIPQSPAWDDKQTLLSRLGQLTTQFGFHVLQRIPIKRATDRKIKTTTGLHSSALFCGGFEIKVL
jgi:hypothetical protein